MLPMERREPLYECGIRSLPRKGRKVPGDFDLGRRYSSAPFAEVLHARLIGPQRALGVRGHQKLPERGPRGVAPNRIASSPCFPTCEFLRAFNVTLYHIEGGNLRERSSESPPRISKIPTNRLSAAKQATA